MGTVPIRTDDLSDVNGKTKFVSPGFDVTYGIHSTLELANWPTESLFREPPTSEMSASVSCKNAKAAAIASRAARPGSMPFTAM